MPLQTMPVAKASLEKLRAIPGILPMPPKREGLPFSLAPEPIPQGKLTEVTGLAGSGKAELALRFAAEHPEMRLAWVERQAGAFPPAFFGLGVRLERVLFVQGGDQAAWAALQVLRSGLFRAVMLHGLGPGETLLRQLQLEAEKAGSAVFLLEEEPLEAGAWALGLRLAVCRGRRLHSPDPLRVEAWKEPRWEVAV